MSEKKDYISINKESWNTRVEPHFNSDFYDVEGFRNGKSSLNSIELDLLGNIKGKKVLHLQCHFGQDTISLAQLGANCTGIDLSNKAIDKARQLSLEMEENVTFICCDLYDLPNHLNEDFDLIFTSYGTIGWLPDIKKWGRIISQFLKPNGRFVFAEFHPFVWMFDDDFEHIIYRYFNTVPIIENETGTYADKNAEIQPKSITWNHALSEVVSSLIENNLQITTLKELDYSPYDCFSHTEEFESGKFRIKHLGNKIPMVYALEAKKKNLL